MNPVVMILRTTFVAQEHRARASFCDCFVHRCCCSHGGCGFFFDDDGERRRCICELGYLEVVRRLQCVRGAGFRGERGWRSIGGVGGDDGEQLGCSCGVSDGGGE